jgi:uncharacterized protein YdeI (YjbR/CyaY-like superfamily)
MKPRFFASPAEFRTWLQKHHAEAQELWVGLHKRRSGKASITWPEAVDQALCFGWIDGVRKSVNSLSYMIRFTPRKPRSTWSTVNIARANELMAQGLMSAAGLSEFQKRSEEKSAIYSYEQRKSAKLEPAQEDLFRANGQAWNFFQKQPPWYQRTSAYWVISAKKEETKMKRLSLLIECSERVNPIPALTRPATKKK